MLLTAVIIVLREILEAALLISVLMAISHSINLSLGWLKIAITTGISGAFIYQYNLESISTSFDYVGQEITNAILQIGMFGCLAFIVINLQDNRSTPKPSLIKTGMSCAVSLAIIREGSEIIIYISSFIHNEKHLLNAGIGGMIGAAIGLSLGTLTYFALRNGEHAYLRILRTLLLAIIAAAMLSQATQLLTQADWLPAQNSLWDTGNWLNENSITGQLLYAIAGYEASPTPLQVASYLFGLISIGLLVFSRQHKAGTSSNV